MFGCEIAGEGGKSSFGTLSLGWMRVRKGIIHSMTTSMDQLMFLGLVIARYIKSLHHVTLYYPALRSASSRKLVRSVLEPSHIALRTN